MLQRQDGHFPLVRIEGSWHAPVCPLHMWYWRPFTFLNTLSHAGLPSTVGKEQWNSSRVSGVLEVSLAASLVHERKEACGKRDFEILKCYIYHIHRQKVRRQKEYGWSLFMVPCALVRWVSSVTMLGCGWRDRSLLARGSEESETELDKHIWAQVIMRHSHILRSTRYSGRMCVNNMCLRAS